MWKFRELHIHKCDFIFYKINIFLDEIIEIYKLHKNLILIGLIFMPKTYVPLGGWTVQGGLGPIGLLTLPSENLEKSLFAGYVDLNLIDKILSLESLSFSVDGKTCITSRVYPALTNYGNAHLFCFNNSTKIVKIETLDA
ncbi:hypothetical protein H5410_046021 [Solanum commersonii]|uniref:Uncharacterized protein n=1 Tax=Solanum commersonii TaxID=4109 RepID=A0A9J5XB45_SOLCO|nr:hypothetical protein H5410_046021 [Solanum commersonii]